MTKEAERVLAEVRPPSDDTSTNYQDGYTDGSFKRREATMA